MHQSILIAGGGIGGLAAALACSRARQPVELFERAQAFGEVGAGIQMGPNVVRILQGWGLKKALTQVAAFPQELQVRSAETAQTLGKLRLGEHVREKYGAPYATIHRADLHKLLLLAVQQQPGITLHTGAALERFVQDAGGVQIDLGAGITFEGAALVGADGIRSAVRRQLLGDGAPRVSGHVAYRAMVSQRDLPPNLRSQNITVWLGHNLHLVQYPVRNGAWLNVVGIVTGQLEDGADEWDHAANARDLQLAYAGTCSALQELIAAIAHWRAWSLCDRAPMQGAFEQAQGRVALLGDAAHPMRPYMAQGAGMAIEDAAGLQDVLGQVDAGMEQLLSRYAQLRWQRNARVQNRSIRNGEIFHSSGLMRWGRDFSMRVLGEKLLDVPWLYRGPGY